MSHPIVSVTLVEDGLRKCGECSLCCKLLPMHTGMRVGNTTVELHKKAGERCKHQRHGKGCAIYAVRPDGCRFWNCRWLSNSDTADLARPDRSRYVIDIAPDFIIMQPDGPDGESITVEVVQVWCDPKLREAWRDPKLLEFLDRRGREGIAALIRYSETDAITVFPPSMSADREWHVFHSGSMVKEHTFAEKVAAVQAAQKVIIGASDNEAQSQTDPSASQ